MIEVSDKIDKMVGYFFELRDYFLHNYECGGIKEVDKLVNMYEEIELAGLDHRSVDVIHDIYVSDEDHFGEVYCMDCGGEIFD